MTDCDACLSGEHNGCVGAGCACFERTCAEAERSGEGRGITVNYEPNTFDRWVTRLFGRKSNG